MKCLIKENNVEKVVGFATNARMPVIFKKNSIYFLKANLCSCWKLFINL